MPNAAIRPGDVDEWIAGIRAEHLSPSRIRQAHVVLSAGDRALRARPARRRITVDLTEG
jgi:hypothetical protein